MSEGQATYDTKGQNTARSVIIPRLIRGLVEIEDELESRGANALLARKEKLRDLLKDAMAQADVLEAVDEKSGFRALIKLSFTDTYPDLTVLAEALPRPEMIDEATELVVKAAVIKGWVSGGLVTWSGLQASGALVRKLRSRSLFLEPLPLIRDLHLPAPPEGPEEGEQP